MNFQKNSTKGKRDTAKVTLLHVECPQFVINCSAAYSIGFTGMMVSHMNFLEKSSNGSRVTGVNALLFV